jgi:hypothetical protein
MRRASYARPPPIIDLIDRIRTERDARIGELRSVLARRPVHSRSQ